MRDAGARAAFIVATTAAPQVFAAVVSVFGGCLVWITAVIAAILVNQTPLPEGATSAQPALVEAEGLTIGTLALPTLAGRAFRQRGPAPQTHCPFTHESARGARASPQEPQ